VGGEVEVPRHPVDLEGPFHPAPLFLLDVLHDSLENLLVAHAFVILINTSVRIWHVLWQTDLHEVLLHIDQMHLQYILDVQGQERTRVSLELDVNVDLQLLVQMLLVDDKVTVHDGLLELENCRGYQEDQKTHSSDRYARA
jgi:hypothetical protein